VGCTGRSEAYNARVGLLSLNKHTSSIVDSSDEFWEQLRPVSLQPHNKLHKWGYYYFFTRTFWPTIVRHAETKSNLPVIWSDVFYMPSRLLHIICYCFLLQWKVIVRDPVCQRARVSSCRARSRASGARSRWRHSVCLQHERGLVARFRHFIHKDLMLDNMCNIFFIPTAILS